MELHIQNKEENNNTFVCLIFSILFGEGRIYYFQPSILVALYNTCNGIRNQLEKVVPKSIGDRYFFEKKNGIFMTNFRTLGDPVVCAELRVYKDDILTKEYSTTTYIDEKYTYVYEKVNFSWESYIDTDIFNKETSKKIILDDFFTIYNPILLFYDSYCEAQLCEKYDI